LNNGVTESKENVFAEGRTLMLMLEVVTTLSKLSIGDQATAVAVQIEDYYNLLTGLRF
jgi:hypothetical protein